MHEYTHCIQSYSPRVIPSWMVFLDAMSYVKYGYTAATLNDYSGLKLTCKKSELKYNAQGQQFCPVTRGEQVTDDLGMSL
jgi:hypothetical protein